MLQELLDHFGSSRLIDLAVEIHTRMSREGFGPPRTFLGHLQQLRNLMLQELQSSGAGFHGSARAHCLPAAVPPSSVQGQSQAAPFAARGLSPVAVPPSAVSQAPALAVEFLTSIGFSHPSTPMLSRSTSVIGNLLAEGFTDEDLRIAFRLAAGMDAHGPGILPYLVGRSSCRRDSSPADTLTNWVSTREERERAEWAARAASFDALPSADQGSLIRQAQASNPALARRGADHPLVRAAAIALLDGNDSPESTVQSPEPTP
jgi:hypothetical protein